MVCRLIWPDFMTKWGDRGRADPQTRRPTDPEIHALGGEREKGEKGKREERWA